eukprot:1193546-Prorocentrum_minimum.AAC.2
MSTGKGGTHTSVMTSAGGKGSGGMSVMTGLGAVVRELCVLWSYSATCVSVDVLTCEGGAMLQAFFLAICYTLTRRVLPPALDQLSILTAQVTPPDGVQVYGSTCCSDWQPFNPPNVRFAVHHMCAAGSSQHPWSFPTL